MMPTTSPVGISKTSQMKPFLVSITLGGDKLIYGEGCEFSDGASAVRVYGVNTIMTFSNRAEMEVGVVAYLLGCFDTLLPAGTKTVEFTPVLDPNSTIHLENLEGRPPLHVVE